MAPRGDPAAYSASSLPSPNIIEVNPEAIEKGTYPIWSYEHMFTSAPASEGARSFIDFFLSPEIQQTLVRTQGFIPIAAMKTARNE